MGTISYAALGVTWELGVVYDRNRNVVFKEKDSCEANKTMRTWSAAYHLIRDGGGSHDQAIKAVNNAYRICLT